MKEKNTNKKYDEMSDLEKHEYHKQSMEKIRQERIAKRDPNAIVNTLTNISKNQSWEGVSIGGRIDPANNWYKENDWHLMDLSYIHSETDGLSDRINNEIVKPINDYLLEKTGTEYVHKHIPNYKGYADVPNILDELFHQVCEQIQIGFEIDFETFAVETIQQHKKYIDDEIAKNRIPNGKTNNSIE